MVAVVSIRPFACDILKSGQPNGFYIREQRENKRDGLSRRMRDAAHSQQKLMNLLRGRD
jgi:hypothetical protein